MKRLTLAFVGIAVAVAGCSPMGSTPAGSVTESVTSDAPQAGCDGRGGVWTDDRNGCLTPSEIEMWKTSGCADEDFATCRDEGFPDFEETEVLVPAPPAPLEPAPPPPAVWVCSYDPTYDDDWHNDVLCTNGAEFDRPYLRDWDTFITEDEMNESAREYEQQLNGA